MIGSAISSDNALGRSLIDRRLFLQGVATAGLLAGSGAPAAAREPAPHWPIRELPNPHSHEWPGAIYLGGEGAYMLSICSGAHVASPGDAVWLTALAGPRAPQRRILWSRPGRTPRVVAGLAMAAGKFGAIVQHDGVSGYPDRKYSFISTENLEDLSSWRETDITQTLRHAPDIILYGQPIAGDAPGEYLFYGYAYRSRENADIMLVRTTDNGASWSSREILSIAPGQPPPVEASVFKLSGGGYGMFARPGGLRYGETSVAQVGYSENGLDWAPLRITDIPMAPAAVTAFEEGGRIHILTTSRDHTALAGVRDAILHRAIDPAAFRETRGAMSYGPPNVLWRLPGRALGYMRYAFSQDGSIWGVVNGGEDPARTGDPAFNRTWSFGPEYVPIAPARANLLKNPFFAILAQSASAPGDWTGDGPKGGVFLSEAPATASDRAALPHRPAFGLDVSSPRTSGQRLLQIRPNAPQLAATVSGAPLAGAIYGAGPERPRSLRFEVGVRTASHGDFRYSHSAEIAFSPLAKGVWSGVADWGGPVERGEFSRSTAVVVALENAGAKETWRFRCYGLGLFVGATDGLLTTRR